MSGIDAIQKMNLFQSAAAKSTQGINSTQAFGSGEQAKGMSKNESIFGSKGENPFGVGLVNSSLNDMSFTLPNGKKSLCNTIGIC